MSAKNLKNMYVVNKMMALNLLAKMKMDTQEKALMEKALIDERLWQETMSVVLELLLVLIVEHVVEIEHLQLVIL